LAPRGLQAKNRLTAADARVGEEATPAGIGSDHIECTLGAILPVYGLYARKLPSEYFAGDCFLDF
jgi:hypothetical protein